MSLHGAASSSPTTTTTTTNAVTAVYPRPMTDADDLLDRYYESIHCKNDDDDDNDAAASVTVFPPLSSLRSSTSTMTTKQQQQRRRDRVVYKEQMAVCRHQLQSWDVLDRRSPMLPPRLRGRRRRRQQQQGFDSVEASMLQNVVLTYASALDGLGRTAEAVGLLDGYLDPSSSSEEEEETEDSDEEAHSAATATTNPAAVPSSRVLSEPHQNKENDYYNIPVMLSLAKLYFKEYDHVNAWRLCTAVHHYILQHYQDCHCQQKQQQRDLVEVSSVKDDDKHPKQQPLLQEHWLTSCCSFDDASDAFHLAGWVRIHADDHTAAYRVWKQGADLLPECPILAKQARKRACWDENYGTDKKHMVIGGSSVELDNNDDDTPPFTPLHVSEVDTVLETHEYFTFDAATDFEMFSVPLSCRAKCPALALFASDTQQDNLVVRSRHAILSPAECASVLHHVEMYHTEHCHGRWGTVRHSSAVTTDVAVEDVPALRPWLRSLLQQRLYPMLRTAFPKLADGSTLGHAGGRLRVHDAFVVRYDTQDGSTSLPEHADTSLLSFTVALNQRGDDFVGGGTWFEAVGDERRGMVVDADQGHAVAFAGPLRHAGYPVQSGCRIILVLFLYAEDYEYGKMLKSHLEEHESSCHTAASASTACSGRRPSGDKPGGFVVYNQTVELVSMLNRRVSSF